MDRYLVCHPTLRFQLPLMSFASARLIVVAVVVELVCTIIHSKDGLHTHFHHFSQGEIIARLIVHAAMRKETLPQVTSKVGVLRTLGRAMLRS